ncbi:putative Translocon associated protein (TRAP) alpha subunit [Trypanosoma vivax]|uniref:Uncharacterized protein n=1 Tax=Trypanosoma vivax (strain Y486) TaxID=1055687 RepID=G0TY20_TRYVY|nr:hypothetical protein TRVL_01665 [Trypanosoma vivax]KAH8618641.1 putative Translocon associated protein (TRAP) alpha subunit [Trypanosoma vivax]CCC48865.1 conserved hypothetical protein [Trypanosoma vivax Y486]
MCVLRGSTPLLLVALLAASCSFATLRAYAEAQANAEEVKVTGDDTNFGNEEVRPAPTVQVIFPKSQVATTPTLPAGSRADGVIGYRNNDPKSNHTIIVVVGGISPLNVYDKMLQNFSAVRHARQVLSGETVSLHYSFTPHPLLEPNEYNLALGLFYTQSATNETHYVNVFNDTVTIDASLDTDPQTYLTYLVLIVLMGVIGYYAAGAFGIFRHGQKGSGSGERRRVEVGTRGEGYDPDYVSSEHLRYKEAVLQRKNSQSPKRTK